MLTQTGWSLCFCGGSCTPAAPGFVVQSDFTENSLSRTRVWMSTSPGSCPALLCSKKTELAVPALEDLVAGSWEPDGQEFYFHFLGMGLLPAQALVSRSLPCLILLTSGDDFVERAGDSESPGGSPAGGRA